jgi:hypothetical protein
LTVPVGVKVEAVVTGSILESVAGLASGWLVTDLDVADTAPNLTGLAHGEKSAAEVRTGHNTIRVWTNTSAQVRSRLTASDADTIFRLMTEGWYDTRGRDD